jgi:hypothetical protein
VSWFTDVVLIAAGVSGSLETGDVSAAVRAGYGF